MPMDPKYFRTRLFFDLCNTIAVPVIVLSLLLNFSGHRLPGLFVVPSQLASIIVWAFAKRTLLDLRQRREAKQLGAKPIPRVVGKWPGNIDVLLKMLKAFKTAYVVDVYQQLFDEYQCTTLNLYIFWADQIVTMDHEHVKFVLATGFNHFWRGYAQKERMENFLGVGIFNRDDDVSPVTNHSMPAHANHHQQFRSGKWLVPSSHYHLKNAHPHNAIPTTKHRTMTRPFFARERISDFDIFERHTQLTLSHLSNSCAASTALDAQDLYARFTIDAASEFLFGRNLSTLSGDLPIPGETPMGPKGSATRDSWGTFTGAFEAAQTIVASRTRIGWLWPLFEMFGDRSERYCRVIRRWLDPLVRQALQDRERERERGTTDGSLKDKTFLQHLVDSTSDPVLIRDQLLSMLLASRDTTACLLTFVTYIMAIHPEVAVRLRAEVLEHCGPDAAPTYDQIRGLKYMRAVINETLRLFPPVPLNVRESRSAPCALPPSDTTYNHTDSHGDSDSGEKLYMPGSTTIIYLPLLFQKNKALWGEDAEEFDPERWLDPERVKKFVEKPSMWGAFSAGPRINLTTGAWTYDRFMLAPDAQPAASLPPAEWKNRQGRQSVEKVWPAAAMTLFIKVGDLIV
ncbi:hypothetical protein H0H92_008479 [Tricholoma furcatifolium]|nr:hypothetical protein H0H92_008479 [Tricholoma furcatifolium]